MSSFVKVEGRSFLTIVAKSGEVIFFEVDDWAVPFLKKMGNFHPVYSDRPKQTPPVLRRRGPAGHAIAIPLPKIVAVLQSAGDDETRSRVAGDYNLLINAASQIRISRYANDDNKLNCTLKNWTRASTSILHSSLLTDDGQSEWVPPTPEITPEREREILRELSEVPPSAEDTNPISSPTIDERMDPDSLKAKLSELPSEAQKMHAKVSVDDILKMARSSPAGTHRTEWEHYLQTCFPDNFDLPCC